MVPAIIVNRDKCNAVIGSGAGSARGLHYKNKNKKAKQTLATVSSHKNTERAVAAELPTNILRMRKTLDEIGL